MGNLKKMPDKKAVKRPKWYGSPHHHSPETYYGQLWVDHKTFDSVRLFADWNKLSLKSAAHQFLNFGLTYYAIAQLRLEQARQANEKMPTPTKLFSPGEITNALSSIYKKRKELPKIPGQEDRHPF